ncbi:MAG: response regulator [Candidatus Binatia bacterium]
MPQKILLVDDDKSILFALSEYFTAYGYQVECAQEPEEAEALLALGGCSVVITDLRLSGIHSTEGLDVVRYVREHSPATRVILLTAYGSLQIENEARRRGADAFLDKPKPLAEVARVVSELLGKGS